MLDVISEVLKKMIAEHCTVLLTVLNIEKYSLEVEKSKI